MAVFWNPAVPAKLQELISGLIEAKEKYNLPDDLPV